MTVRTQSVNFKADVTLLDFVQQRLDKLDQYFDRVVDAEVFLRTENTSDKENKTAEVKLSVPGDVFVVKKTSKSFEESIDNCQDSLRRKLRKHNQKEKAHNA